MRDSRRQEVQVPAIGVLQAGSDFSDDFLIELVRRLVKRNEPNVESRLVHRSSVAPGGNRPAVIGPRERRVEKNRRSVWLSELSRPESRSLEQLLEARTNHGPVTVKLSELVSCVRRVALFTRSVPDPEINVAATTRVIV